MKFEIVPGLKYVDRAGWGADESLPRLGRKVSRRKRTHVIFHHTVMIDSDETPNIWEREADIFKMMRRLQVVRRDTLGADVPYNFVAFFARNNGVYMCEGRGEDRTGAHTKGHNTAGIAISLAGDFHQLEDDNFVEIAQRVHLLSFFIGWLRFSGSHPDLGNFPAMRHLQDLRPDTREVWAHRDFKPTACPGDHFEPHLKQITFLALPSV